MREGRPHIVDMIKNDEISLIVNTTEGQAGDPRVALDPPRGRGAQGHVLHDAWPVRLATCEAIDHLGEVEVNRLQDLHKEVWV